MKKLLFFDLDGTLAKNDGPPSKAVAAALRRAKQSGCGIFLCTGRTKGYVYASILQLPFDGMITGAGARVEVGARLLYNRLLPPSLLQSYLDLFFERQIAGLLEGTDEILLFGRRPGPNWRFGHLESAAQFGERFAGVPIHKLSIWQALDRELLSRAAADFQVYDYGCAAEFIPTGCSKAAGMKQVADYYGVPMADTVAFGDSINDIPMLRAAGTGVCMANGFEAAKKAADCVAPALDEDGVAVWIREHILGNGEDV